MSTYCRRTVELDGDVLGERALPTVVDSADAALAVITTAMHHPPQPQVIVLVLDTDLGGHAVVIVDGTDSPDAVIDVVELLAEGAAEAGHPATFVVAAVRPGYGRPAGRRRPLAGAVRDRRDPRLRAPRVVHLQRRRRLVSTRPARRATAAGRDRSPTRSR